MLLSPATHSLLRKAIDVSIRISLFLLLCMTTGFAQKAQPDDSDLPTSGLHTEMKTNGVVGEVRLFQEEMGISFSKGEPDP